MERRNAAGNVVREESRMKIKVFLNIGNAPALEREINKWLKENPKIKIMQIKQNYAYGNREFNTIISVWYTD